MFQRFQFLFVLLFVLLLIAIPFRATFGDDYYVSASRGKGKKATKENPAKDLGNIISKLKPGDTVHIAGGVYSGRGGCGSNVIRIPVNIIGGYDDYFSCRDPWGEHRTIFSADNGSKNWSRDPALMINLANYKQKNMPEIKIDGIIVDNADRNHYKTTAQLKIIRSANPKTKQNPTPDRGGIVVLVSKTGDLAGRWKITIQNCIVANTAPAQGALMVSGYKNSKITIRNNLVINNTGTGISVGTKYAAMDEAAKPQFLIENNTVLFTWKYDESAQSYTGNSLKSDARISATVKNNVFAFADRYGIQNAGKSNLLLKNNLIAGNVAADYLEFNTQINLNDIEDEAEHIHEDSHGNSKKIPKVSVSKKWATNFAGRVLVDRNASEADIKVQMTVANEIRSIFGIPLRAGTFKSKSSPVWLNRISLDDAIGCGIKQYDGLGCQKPAKTDE